MRFHRSPSYETSLCVPIRSPAFSLTWQVLLHNDRANLRSLIRRVAQLAITARGAQLAAGLSEAIAKAPYFGIEGTRFKAVGPNRREGL